MGKLTPKRNTDNNLTDNRGNLVDESRWWFVEQAVNAFVAEFPNAWLEFQKDIKENRTIYGEANKEHKGLRRSAWRVMASFPSVFNPKSNTTDSLFMVIEKIIPGFCDTHKKKLFNEFLRRLPAFKTAERV